MLTESQRGLLARVARGEALEEIAAACGLSPADIHRQIRDALQAVRDADRVDADATRNVPVVG